MRTHVYRPDLKDNDGNLFFEGEIEVKKPHWKERQQTRQKLASLEEKDMESMMMDMAEEAVVKVDLKVPSLGLEIKSFDDLMDYQEGYLVAIKIGEIQTSGIALGNGLKQLLNNK